VLGGGVVLTLITLVVIGYLLIERWYASTLLLLVAVGGGMLLTNVLKGYFDRDRPTVVPHLADTLFKSYPSGHSMMSSVVYLTLAVLLARAMERRRVKVYCVAVALLLSLMVGASRVYLGVHYPTDVICRLGRRNSLGAALLAGSLLAGKARPSRASAQMKVTPARKAELRI